MADSSLTWASSTPGVWQRGIDEVEQFYLSLNRIYEGTGRNVFAIMGHLSLIVGSLVGEDPVESENRVDEALRRAWLALRFDQPTIASQVIYDEEKQSFQKIYRTLDGDEDQEAWVTETFQQVPGVQTGAEWVNSQPPAPKLPTLFVIKPASLADDGESTMIRRDLVFYSPHHIIDGMGTLYLLNNLLTHAAHLHESDHPYIPPTFSGTEVPNLSPPLRVAAQVPPTLTEDQKQRLSEVAAEQKAAEEGSELIGIPFKQGVAIPGKHQRVAITLSAKETVQILEACKSLGVTVTHAFHAAVTMVVRGLQQPTTEAKRGHFISYLLQNERGSCVDPYNTPKHAAAVYHSISRKGLTVHMDLPTTSTPGLGGKTSRKEEFIELAKQTKTYYDEVRKDDDQTALACAVWASRTPPLPPPKAREVFPVPPPQPLAPVSISSLGRMDSVINHHHGMFQAFSPWVVSEELRNALALFLGSFRNELCLSGAYNDAWHDEDEIMEFLDRCKEAVVEGLGLV